MTNSKQAKFILSFDFEIGWGDVTNSRWVAREKAGVYKNLRSVLKNMLNEFDVLELPATWATVGAMITPRNELQLDHLPEHAKKVVHDALGSADNDSFEGRDLFEMLLSSKIQHSIASHTYSHVPFNYKGVDKGFVAKDLELSLEAFSKYNINTDRFVFPENTEGFYPELANAGFKLARVSPDRVRMSRFRYLFSTIASAPPAAKNITSDNNFLIRHSGSMLFNMRAGQYYRLPFVYNQALNGLKSACRNKETVHVWAHPFNFAESSLQFTAFKSFLRQVVKRRDAGDITVSIM